MAVFKVKNMKYATKGKPEEDVKYRTWGFREWYIDLGGNRKQYMSKKYATKAEADDARSEWLRSKTKGAIKKDMRFKELYVEFKAYKGGMVKTTTFQTYKDREQHLKVLDEIKLSDFTIANFEMWKKTLDDTEMATITKNGIYKYLKAILNYGMKFHNLDISDTYRKMEGFSDPNAIEKEMDFYTPEEFKHFISFETELRYICLFETLYYCALRNGEMRGVTWEDIDFNKRTIRINKQVPTWYSRTNFQRELHLTSPKSKSGNRMLPLPKVLLGHLKEYYEVVSKYHNFKKDWFVFGDALPIVADHPANRQRELCKLADLKVIRIHDFRHSCASLLINRGANVTIVAKYLGHSKIEETLRTYTHMFESALNEVVNNIDALVEQTG